MLKVFTTIAILSVAVAAIIFNYQSSNKASQVYSVIGGAEVKDEPLKAASTEVLTHRRRKARLKPGETKSPAFRPNFKIDGLDTIIEKHAEWEFLAGKHPESNWTKLDFDSSGWRKGMAGFGYGDNDDNTVIRRMINNYTVIYTRKEFIIEDPKALSSIGIAARYDDGFIAYLNGELVVRSIVDSGSGVNARGFYRHEATEYEYFSLDKHKKLLKEGKNVLAIEGHNVTLDSNDLTLDVYLLGGN